jgi:hypothetical protein
LSDAGVLEFGERLRFLLESPEELARGVSRLEQLQRDRAARLFLLGLIDNSHTAFAEQANDLKLSDLSGYDRLQEISGCPICTDQGLDFGAQRGIVPRKVPWLLRIWEFEHLGERVLNLRP